jgi:hypothetical protein
MADFADRTADAVVRIEEDTVSPDPGDDLLARDDLAGVFYEQQENLERYALQPQDIFAPAQPAWAKVQLEIFAEENRWLQPGRGWTHGNGR